MTDEQYDAKGLVSCSRCFHGPVCSLRADIGVRLATQLYFRSFRKGKEVAAAAFCIMAAACKFYSGNATAAGAEHREPGAEG